MDRNSDDDSQMNDDSSDTNLPMSNHIDSDIKTPGKQTTNPAFSTNGSLNGIDRNSPNRDILTKQKSFNASAKKTVKRVRQR